MLLLNLLYTRFKTRVHYLYWKFGFDVKSVWFIVCREFEFSCYDYEITV